MDSTVTFHTNNIQNEENLIQLFEFIQIFHSNKLIVRDEYSAVVSENSVWPNFIFNINANEDDAEIIVSEINSEIEKDNLPPFIITGTKTERKFFEDIFFNYNIRKIMEWNAMSIDLNTFAFSKNEGISIKKVTNEIELNYWLEIVSTELFNNKKINLLPDLLQSDRLNLYLGFEEEYPVSTAMLFLSKGIAGVYMISTSKNFRNKGHGKYITKFVLNEAKKRNFQTAILQSTTEGYPVYKKIGFKESGFFHIYWKINKSI